MIACTDIRQHRTTITSGQVGGGGGGGVGARGCHGKGNSALAAIRLGCRAWRARGVLMPPTALCLASLLPRSMTPATNVFSPAKTQIFAWL